MKNMEIPVCLHFINTHEGGWRDLPESVEQYACTARFPDINTEKRETHWSLVIKIDLYCFETGEITGKARFLAHHVPDEIRTTRRFELYEGPRFIGHGVFL